MPEEITSIHSWSGVVTDPSFGAANVTLSEFRAQLNTDFRVDADGEPLSLRLAEIVEGRAAAGYEQFSLFFHGPATRTLPQALHHLRHDAIGDLTIFMVPTADSSAETIVYEASFYRKSLNRPSE